MGFRYLASSLPIICLTGVAIGVGLIFAFLVFSISRNPSISNNLIRWSFIGFSLVEVSGFIGLVYSFLILYAFYRLLDDLISYLYYCSSYMFIIFDLLNKLSYFISFILILK